jgi:hypothetical protein
LAAFVVAVFVRSWVAGTLLVFTLFVLLVAAIGFTNWRAQR